MNVRVVAATNRALEPMMAAGSFREDLFYRLNVVPIHLPPLRERREDVGALARHFLSQAIGEGLPRRGITAEAVDALSIRPWRGNVRELRNAVLRLALMGRENVIDAALVAEALGPCADTLQTDAHAGLAPALLAWLEMERPTDGALYHRALAELERPLFDWVLARTGGNQLAAARILGINRNTLRKRLADLATGELRRN